MNTVTEAALIALVLPLLSFLIIGIFGKKLPRKGDWVAVSFTFISFLLSVYCFVTTWNQPVHHYSVNWLNTGIININIGFTLDNLAVLMLMLVTLITTLVFVYSMEYMKGERYYHRYFAHLSLFLFAMLGVVLADSLFLIYIFWELVGFASYLLIGFWFERDSATAANKKAFIVNRIGDIAFLIGLLVLITQFGTLDLKTLFGESGNVGLIQQSAIENGYWKFVDSGGKTIVLNQTMLTVAGLCIFGGAVAKSAQFPLHVWLPDAMEGPTSVSSLIHAATMVAAGVYLTARVFPLFSPEALTVITYIGSFTAFMAATIAITQNDIKRVLAYSTVSQLGFMIAALGVGAWSVALFHLVTHAFFKCLLFLGAGSVIHQLHHVQHEQHLDFDPQDMRLMGGLRKQMPITHAVLLVASLSLAGLPLFSGYLSKDPILVNAWSWASKGGIDLIPPILLSIAALFTSFYIFRLIFKVFWGENRLAIKFPQNEVNVNESSKLMTIPMMILAVFTLFFIFSLNPVHGLDAWIISGLHAPLNSFNEPLLLSHTVEQLVPISTVIIAVLMIVLAWRTYVQEKISFLPETNPLFKFSFNAWYFDRFYKVIFLNPVMVFTRFIKWFDVVIVDGIVNGAASLVQGISMVIDWIDRNVVDGCVNGIAFLSGRIGEFFRGFQTGRVQQYMALSVFGLILIIVLSYFF